MAPRRAALGPALAACVLLLAAHAPAPAAASISTTTTTRTPAPLVFPKGPSVRLSTLAPATATATATAGPASSTGDSLELSEDKELVYEDLLEHHAVVCPTPMCKCRHVGSGGIAAKCSTLDFKGQRFQGIVNHLEVTDAPEFDDGLFLLNNSLASLGLQFLTTVKISNSSIKGLSLFTFEGLTDLYDVDLSYNHIMIPHQDVFLKNTVLRKLSLRGNPLGVSQVVENTLEKSHLLNSASLNELDLSQCDLDFLSPHIFSRMKHLERLLLAGNKLKTLHPETLSGLGELEELDLSSNYIREITTAMFVNNTELTELRLRNNSLHSLAGVEILGLDELDVSENWFESLDADTLLGFPALTRLNLSDNAVRRVDPKALAPLRYLQDLDLSGNDIQGALPRDLLAACEVLETLNLSDNPLMEALPAGGFRGVFTALYQLDLSYTGLRSLEEDSFVGMDHLSILNLQANQLAEVKVGVLRRLPQLVTLDLSDNQIAALDTKTFQTNGFLRHLDLSGNPLATVSPHVFRGTPYLRWLDLSHCKLTALWESQAVSDRVSLLHKLGHLNVAGNRIETLRVSEVALAGGLAVLDISNNPLKCTKELHYLMEWLVKHSVTPRSDRKLAGGGGLQNDLMHAVEDMMEERSLRGRWASVYDALCGPSAFDQERAKLQSSILASASKPAEPAEPAPASEAAVEPPKSVTQEELDDIKMVLGKKKISAPQDDGDDDDDDDSYADSDDSDSNVEEADDEDDDEDDDDEDDDEYDDTNLIADALNPAHRGSRYLWPVLTIAALVASTALIVSSAVLCVLRRRRARRHARFQSPMFRHLGNLNLPAQHKTFGGIPGSFIKTKKDGGFVYKKLYEETTTPNAPVYFPQAHAHTNTFKFPLDPSELQDPSRV